MYNGSIYYGRRGAAVHAISGIEIALWDIAGKAAGKPIHALLGGMKRSRIKAYASTLMPDTPEETRRVVAEQLDAGFDAVKLGWGPLGRDADLDVALVAAAREAAGDDFDLMIDVGKGWSDVDDAIRRARRMEEYRPYWIEEPFMPDEYGKYRALAEAVETPIAGGEEETTLLDFERLVDQGGVEVVQPDVTRAGGISECLRIAAMAQIGAGGPSCTPGAPASSRPRVSTSSPRWRRPITSSTASRRRSSISASWSSVSRSWTASLTSPRNPDSASRSTTTSFRNASCRRERDGVGQSTES